LWEIELLRPPLSLFLITIAGLLLACLLTWEGLFMRLFTDFRDPAAFWLQGATKLGLHPLKLAWPWIVVGISWIGALVGIWLKSPWGKGAGLILGLLSLFHVGVGSVAAVFVLICISLPSTRNWITSTNATR
jgi:hypothetical protein